MQILVVGGGVAGLATAVALRRVGLEPVVVERERSFAPRGWVALWPDTVELFEWLNLPGDVAGLGAPAPEWRLRDGEGAVLEARTADGVGRLTVPYHRLQARLASAVPDRHLRLDTRVRSLDREPPSVVATFGTGVEEPFDLVVGADGPASTVRRHLCEPERTPTTPTRSVGFSLSGDGVEGMTEVWTADGVVRVAPVDDGAVAWVTVPGSGEAGATPGDVLAGLGDALPSTRVLSRETGEAVDHTVRRPVWTGPAAALVGAAAHACHPLSGLGVTLAVEDAIVLTTEIGDVDTPLATRLDGYRARRRERLRRRSERAVSTTPLDAVGVVPEWLPARVHERRSRRLYRVFSGGDRGAAVTPP